MSTSTITPTILLIYCKDNSAINQRTGQRTSVWSVVTKVQYIQRSSLLPELIFFLFKDFQGRKNKKRFLYLLFAKVCACSVSGEPNRANCCDSDVKDNEWKISLLFLFPGQINYLLHCEIGRIECWVQQCTSPGKPYVRTFEKTSSIIVYKRITWLTHVGRLLWHPTANNNLWNLPSSQPQTAEPVKASKDGRHCLGDIFSRFAWLWYRSTVPTNLPIRCAQFSPFFLPPPFGSHRGSTVSKHICAF